MISWLPPRPPHAPRCSSCMLSLGSVADRRCTLHPTHAIDHEACWQCCAARGAAADAWEMTCQEHMLSWRHTCTHAPEAILPGAPTAPPGLTARKATHRRVCVSVSNGAGHLAACWGATCAACKCRVNAASELQGLNVSSTHGKAKNKSNFCRSAIYALRRVQNTLTCPNP